ncbi:MAG: hypothetical protein L3K26_09140 [Candidatus Hydrogenedentes bacterium]|nr:hypothetical protein [Candidatus Hydrogenedentota bacterium]
MGVLTFGMVVVAGLLSLPGAVQYIDVDTGWTVENKGPWQSRVDHRKLLAMHHPWIASDGGNYAMAWREVEVPEEWGDSVTLTFYNSDDYHGVARGNLPGIGFVGHRRKQILINHKPVWTEDVSDAVSPGSAPLYRVTVPVPAENRTLRITLLAYDAVPSKEATKDDFYRPPSADLTRDTDPNAERFRTTVYWGDLALHSDDAPLSNRPRPSERQVLEQHDQFWPPKPDTAPWKKKRPVLTISTPAGLPKAGFPLEMGIPLPEGVVQSPNAFRLANGKNQALYSQKNVAATWPDGSLRWVLAQFPVKTSTKAVSLAFSKDGARPSGKNTVKDTDDGLSVSAGTVSLRVGTGDPITAITYRNKTVFKGMQLAMEVGGKSVSGTNDDWQVIDEGPFHTRMLLQGRFEGLDSSLGTYALYCSVYQGLPYIKLWFRYFNDTETPQAVSRMDVVFDLPNPLKSVKLPHGAVPSSFSLTQQDVDSYSLDGEVHSAETPFFVAWSQGALAVKDFGALHPKGVRLTEEKMVLSLVDGGSSPITFTPGEAKSHEIWIALGPTDGAQLAATVAQPPVLQNSAYYSASGAFGPAAPLPEEHPWARFLDDTYGTKSLPSLGMATGVRHFPDSYYLGKKGQWSNNYNGRMMSLWHTWLATGDRIWFDRATAVCSHLMDVAVVHSEVPGHDWLGAIHGPGANHVAGPWNPLMRAEGFSLFAHLTGNPEAQADFLGVADYCTRTGVGLSGPNVRHWVGPFSTLVAAYQETGEIALLEAGTERLTSMYGRIDRRRGTWIDWHATSTYPGNIPWMNAQLALPLYTWYRLTGDVEAAQLLVGLAESMVCENTPWEEPGAMKTYSPDPHFPSTTAYDPFIIPMIAAAYELTGDPFFRDAARAQWKRWKAKPEFQSAFNLSWHMPWLNAVLVEFADVE